MTQSRRTEGCGMEECRVCQNRGWHFINGRFERCKCCYRCATHLDATDEVYRLALVGWKFERKTDPPENEKPS